ncbi:MAG: DUF1080 domain-containing protein [Verrucomicrobiaceae bacterium]|nr:DUF1080 domain-containing protein [Verrucomicrobiaceae bacterium]
MNSETPPSSDPLFGNNPSDLMREAMDPATRIPTGDPYAWQPPTPEDLQARLGGAYLVQAFLARGGMGAVYRGIQASLERPVAIKILPPQLRDADPSFAQRFKQEAKAMAQLNHPSIVSVYDFGEMPDGTLYFIMEFVDGTDVAQMVTRQGRLSSAHAMAITAHVCDALQYAHEHGVVHRDIKPANIMVGNDGRVKVADFGLAKSSRVTATSLTMTGHVMGTPHFLAPEALTLGSSVDHRADIYAVGVMLYQMLTGRLPKGIFEMPSLLVPGLDPRYDAIITAAMREDRTARYQAILDMRRALDAILTKPVAKSAATPQQPAAAAPPAQAAAPKPQPGQHYYRPPQAAAPPPRNKEKTSAGMWLLVAAVVLSLGGIFWMKMGNSASSATTPSVAESTVSAPESAKPSQMGPLGDLVFPTVQFENATISECIEYFQIKSRDLDPAKKGITFLVDEATRKSTASVGLDLKEIRVVDFIECFARYARLEVSYVGEAIQLKTSPSVKPPFPIGAPSSKFQQLGETIFPKVSFENATLEEACEYLRLKSRDLSGQHFNLIIDPELTQRKHEISLDLTQVPLSDALAYITALSDAEVTYLAAAIYIQPKSSSAAKLPLIIGTSTPKLQQVGETIIPYMDFQKASIQEACEYLRIKGREISGQPVNLIIDPTLAQRKHEISLWVPRVSLSAALSYIADLCDAEVAYLREAFYLQPRSTKPVQVDPYANQPWGEVGKIVLPTVRFQNATVGEAVEYLRFKSRDLDPEKKGMVIILDDAASRAAGTITLDSKDITVANALAQIATVAGLEIYRLGEAARLRAPATARTTPAAAPKPEPPRTSVSAPPAPPKPEPEFRTFTDSRGRQIQASLIRVQKDDVTLKTEDGKEHTFKAATLSAADIEYLKTKGLVTPQTPAVAQDQVINLFNGRDLSGWTVRTGKADFRVKDGCIVGKNTTSQQKGFIHTFLTTNAEFGDFILTFEYKADADVNSGVQFRSQFHNVETRAVTQTGRTVIRPPDRVYGYQFEIDSAGKRNSGAIYDEGRRGVFLDDLGSNPAAQAAVRIGDWNQARIECRGDSIKTFLNGIPAASITDEVTPKGVIALQVHGSTKPSAEVRWRNIKLLPLTTNQTSATTTVTTVIPAAPKPPAPVVEPPKPAAVPAPSAPTTYGGMEFSPNWLPQTLSARRELLESYDFYCKAVVGNAPKGQEPVPDTIVGAIRWRMPIDEAIRTLPKGFNKLSERPMVHSCLPNNSLINCGFQYRSFQDRGQSFYEMFMLIDKQRRVVSVMFRDNGKDIQWFPKPDGIREPYYNMFSELTYNGSTTQEVPYQILGAGNGVTCIKTALRKKIITLPNMPNMPQMAPSGGGTKENVHWYLPAPFARSILDIVEVYRARGVIK